MRLLEGQFRNPSGCAISAVISRNGERMSGEKIIESMRPMHERSNGLGGGFAAYGIYPEYKELFALHLFFNDKAVRHACEDYLRGVLEIVKAEVIPTRTIPAITDEPLIWRYFVTPLRSVLASMQIDENEYIARVVMQVNTQIKGAYVFSSGKNMGVFKAVGFPEDVGEFYRLEEYGAYCWTAHGRYPTNTPGWWGGAHPFALLDWTVVHNGEISSYDANRRCIEMYGYKCTLQTDTEVITYIADYLLRKQGLTLTETASVIAAPFWDLSFPATLKRYFELVNVPGLAFVYTEQGWPRGLCSAKRLYYVTTSGGLIQNEEYGFGYIRALAEGFYQIPEIRCIRAEGLDLPGADIPAILRGAEEEIDRMLAEGKRENPDG